MSAGTSTGGGTEGDQTLAVGPKASAVALAIEPGSVIARYVVLDVLGRGGMGVVARAYDPRLQREVALKLLRSDARGVGDRDAAARLIREARSMARLGHPNVVALFDAGEVEDQVYLAMELVQGQTFGRWREAATRPWNELLGALRQAGAGLVAAHAAGLVHRDFKPDNVLVGDDGRVRVTDFGIARGVEIDAPISQKDGEAPQWSHPGAPIDDADPSRTQDLTEVGMVLGTPAYMAPEQHRGEAADARADQYAWCVVAWESLAGRRPFVGKDPTELGRAKSRGRPITPTGTAVPGWVWAAIERGLEPDPSRRWPDVAALLAVLAQDPAQRRRRRAAVVVGGVIAVGFAGAVVVGRERTRTSCRAQADAIAQAWSEDAKQRIRAAIDAVPPTAAAVTRDKLEPWLERYAVAWAGTREAQCLAHELDGDRSAELSRLGVECLDERRDAFAALVDALGTADALALRGAVQAAADLPAITDCEDDRALLRRPTGVDDDARAEIAAVRSELRRARVQAGLGRFEQPLSIARAALERARALGWEPLIAEGHIALGKLEMEDGDNAASQIDLFEGFLVAGRSGHDDAMAEAATSIVYLLGYALARSDEGLQWGRIADMALARAGDSDGLRRAALASAIGAVHLGRGAHREGRPLFEEARAIRERVLGADHPEVAGTLLNLGVIDHLSGDFVNAQRLMERAVTIHEESLGPDHPSVAMALSNLSAVYHGRSDVAGARALVERALAIYERSYPPDHPNIAHCLHNLAALAELSGDLDDAVELYHRVLAIEERSVGATHPNVAMALHNLAHIHEARGDRADALALQLRAVAAFEAVHGEGNADVDAANIGLARMYRTRGELESARSAYERALVRTGKPDDPDRAERAEARFELAQLIWDEDHARAIDLAKVAAADLRATGGASLANVETWLRDHARSD